MNAHEARKLELLVREAFSQDGIIGPQLAAIHEEEEAYEQFAARSFAGHRVLNQSFLAFFHETLQRADSSRDVLDGTWYVPLLVYYANIFSRFRAAEVIFLHGYPLDAFSLLRDLKDRAIYLAAVISKKTSLRRVLGIPEGGVDASQDYWQVAERLAKRRKSTQLAAWHSIAGKGSGLPQNVQEDLRRWTRMFNDEVHGSWHMFTFESEIWNEGGPLPLGPHKALASMVLYLNRFSEVGWCAHRALPFLQPPGDGFEASWRKKWELLDEYFRAFLQSLVDQEKEMIPSIIRLVDEKFAFGVSLRYSEPVSNQGARD